MNNKIKPEKFISKIRKTGNGLALYLPKSVVSKLNLEDKKNHKLRGYLRADKFIVFDTSLITSTIKEIKEVAESFDRRRDNEKKDNLIDEISYKIIKGLEKKIGEGINVEQVIIKEEKGKVAKIEYKNSLDDDLNFMNEFDTKGLAKKIKS